MKYFKNTELANLYHVSEKTVRNWVQATLEGKLDLRLYETEGRNFIANTANNMNRIERLVDKGKKYKNTRGLKTCSPAPDFYKFYSPKQILDIVSNIEVHREIPVQYSYVDGGAEYWDKYMKRLASQDSPNILNATIDMLELSEDNIASLIGSYKKINIVDLGPGNGLPIRPLVTKLLERNKLGRYIAIDISKELIDIVKSNFKVWFGDQVEVESHIRDIAYERFSDLIAETTFEGSDSINLIFLLGGTISNFRSPNQVLENINNSMGSNDLMITSGYLDTPTTRRFFDFEDRSTKAVKSELILNMLGVRRDDFDLELDFLKEKRAREAHIRLNKDLNITLSLPKGERRLELPKNDRVLLWRYWHRNMVDMINFYDRNEFDVLYSTKSSDLNYYLLATKVKLISEVV